MIVAFLVEGVYSYCLRGRAVPIIIISSSTHHHCFPLKLLAAAITKAGGKQDFLHSSASINRNNSEKSYHRYEDENMG